MTDDERKRVQDVLGGLDGVPPAPDAERKEILQALRSEVWGAIHVLRERYRVAGALKNAAGLAELEEMTRKNLVALDAVDEELTKVGG